MRTRTKPVYHLTDKRKEHFLKFRKLADIIIRREIEKVDAIFIMITGKRGTGKSFTGLSLALSIDPNFTVDQVCFERTEVDQAINKLSWTGGPRIILYDETGATLGSRRWFEKEQIKLIEKFQIIRETGVSIICCMPHLRFGDSSLDLISNFGLEMVMPKHKHDCYRLAKMLQTVGLYSRRAEIDFQPIWLGNKIFHVPILDPREEHQPFFEQYLHKKRLFIEKKQRDEQEQAINITQRQLEYIQAFNAGNTNSQVADQFGVTEDSVKQMKRKLRKRLLLSLVE